jgi:hypothetical protein
MKAESAKSQVANATKLLLKGCIRCMFPMSKQPLHGQPRTSEDRSPAGVRDAVASGFPFLQGGCFRGWLLRGVSLLRADLARRGATFTKLFPTPSPGS